MSARRNTSPLLQYFFFGTVILLIHFIYYYYATPFPAEITLADTDCYMRLVRVEQLWKNKSWYDATIFRSNAPYGEILHWTRPFDLILLAGTALFAPFFNFHTSLLYWGVIISPILHVALYVILAHGFRFTIHEKGLEYLGVILLLQPALFSCFMAGRPDHHSLILVLYAVSLVLMAKILLNPHRLPTTAVAGVVAGIAIWVSVESQIYVYLSIAFMGIMWIFRPTDMARKSFFYAFFLFLTVSAAIFIEYPINEIFSQQYDRISAVHWLITTYIMLYWGTVSLVFHGQPASAAVRPRVLTVIGGVACLVFILYLLLPKFFGGPFVDVHAEIIPIWLDKVREVQPLLSTSRFRLKPLVFWCGPIFVLFPYLGWLLGPKNSERKLLWGFVLLNLLVYFILGLYQIRWLTYVNLLIAITMADLLGRVLERQQIQLRPAVQMVARVLTVIIFSLGFTISSQLLPAVDNEHHEESRVQKELFPELCRFLSSATENGDRLRILSDIDYGPELLYRTSHEVIATPYHRNWQGILTGHKILSAKDDSDAFALIKKRGINAILLPSAGQDFSETDNDKSTFQKRVQKGQLPSWLKEVTLPAPLSEYFCLVNVVKNSKNQHDL